LQLYKQLNQETQELSISQPKVQELREFHKSQDKLLHPNLSVMMMKQFSYTLDSVHARTIVKTIVHMLVGANYMAGP
jgi:hypothetical protein